MKESIHDKAIRLIEGGIVTVDGFSVKLDGDAYNFDPCLCCEMDSICHIGTEMCLVCVECDHIIGHNCILTFA